MILSLSRRVWATLAMITSLLEGRGIAYMVQNEHVSSLYPDSQFSLARMVDECDRSMRSAVEPTAVGGA